MATQAQTDWVFRVLGVSLSPAAASEPAAASGPRIPAAQLMAMFNDAKEEVDVGLSKLQAALRQTGDEDLVRIADYGMFGMTNGAGVGLMKALMELRGAAPDLLDAVGAKARAAATAYKAAVFGHAMVDLVDANPFKVPVGIKAKLGPALDTIARSA